MLTLLFYVKCLLSCNMMKLAAIIFSSVACPWHHYMFHHNLALTFCGIYLTNMTAHDLIPAKLAYI